LKIENHLKETLGYDVATFVRSTSELAAVANYRPFSDSELDGDGNGLYVAFVAKPPSDQAIQKLLSFSTEVDEFHIHGREVYWLCRKKFSESAFSGALLEKTFGMRATVRNSTTVRKITAKYV
jgi:uncharacterized protein (DUF1697 family)